MFREFLPKDLQEELYMQQPPRFVQNGHVPLVCKLMKSLYHLKQAPHDWYEKIHNFFIVVASLPASLSMVYTFPVKIEKPSSLCYMWMISFWLVIPHPWPMTWSNDLRAIFWDNRFSVALFFSRTLNFSNLCWDFPFSYSIHHRSLVALWDRRLQANAYSYLKHHFINI
jgi:hypothetical protein